VRFLIARVAPGCDPEIISTWNDSLVSSQREEAKNGIGTRTLYIYDPCRAAFWPRQIILAYSVETKLSFQVSIFCFFSLTVPLITIDLKD
jgi:hypothetical protein